MPALSFLVVMVAALAAPFTTAGGQTIRNPVLRGFNPDPSIVRVGEDYYIATSTFEWFPGVRIHHSRDLVHWRLLTHALTRSEQLDLMGTPSSGGVWAPGLSHHHGVFHLVYTVVRSCRGGFVDAHNFLVTARAVEGPWSEPIYLNSGGFDPSLFHDHDGRTWLLNMVWDHRSRNKSGGIVLQEYDPGRRALVGKPRLIFKGTRAGGTEAAHLYEHDGYFHLMTAEGGTWYDHVVTMARARKIEGRYEIDPGSPILTSRGDPSLPLQKAGHASLVHTQSGEWYVAYLCGRPLPDSRWCNLGRETSLRKCVWNEDGWLRLAGGGNRPVLEEVAPPLPPYPFPAEPDREDFAGERLSLHFNTLRAPPDPSWLSLTERPGFLRLRGRESLNSRFRPSLVARRLRTFRCAVTTRLEFAPDTYQQLAGLVCFYDHRNYRFLRISRSEKTGRNIAVLSLEKGRMKITEPVSIGDADPCFLRARFDFRELTFHHSTDGKTWRAIGPTFDAGKLSDDYCGGFTGTFVGLAAQDMSGGRKHADFDFLTWDEAP